MRVLVVGNAGERYFGERFYIVERKLANGFTRNGHHVQFFSDRDVARTGTIFRSSRAGRGVANARFLEVVRKFQPNLVVIAHSSLIATESLAEARRLAPGTRLAQICVDPLFRAVNVEFLQDRARVVDATFVTTAGAALARFASASNVSSYVPNPIDASIETARGFERADQAFDVFFAANAAGDRPGDPRRTTPRLILDEGRVSLDYHGFDGRPPLFGAEYFRRLGEARMALNINSDRAETAETRAPADQLYLYNSDRISHLMGSGLLTLSFRVNKLMELFEEEEEMVFVDTPEEMRDAVLRFKRDDIRRRTIAEAGWRKSHAHLNERLVARYIEEVAFRRPFSHPYLADGAVVSAPGKIGVVLPARETFGLRKSGAIALSSRDFALNSRFRDAITILGAAECEYPDVRYRRLTDWRRWWMRGRTAYARAVLRATREEGFAMLEIQNRPYMVGVARKRLPGIKLALHLQNDPRTIDGSRTVAERRSLLHDLDAVYCCSRFIRGRFLEGVFDESGKTIVVYNGIAANPPSAPKEKIIAFVGRVIPDKGVVELVKAFALAAPQLPDWRLAIAGEDNADLLAGPRAALAPEREALAGQLRLLGQVSHADAMALYARAEIAVVPSLWQEPFARSAIEAMASGCALIATPVGGLAEVAADAGIIVDASDIPALAAALRRVATDDGLRARLQQLGQAKAREAFEIRRVTAVLDAARARLLDGI